MRVVGEWRRLDLMWREGIARVPLCGILFGWVWGKTFRLRAGGSVPARPCAFSGELKEGGRSEN